MPKTRMKAANEFAMLGENIASNIANIRPATMAKKATTLLYQSAPPAKISRRMANSHRANRASAVKPPLNNMAR